MRPSMWEANAGKNRLQTDILLTMSMKGYLVQAVAAALFFLFCIGAFNWWSDPYGIWRPVDFERLNRNQQVFYLRMSKPWQISRTRPTAAIIGSSRSGSIDPRHEVWAGEVPYNLSVHGLTLYEMKRFIEHAQAQGRLHKLLIAIEFDTFINTHSRAGLGFAEARMAKPDEGGMSWRSALQWVYDVRDTLFTSTTLALSLQAQLGSRPAGRAVQADGSWRFPVVEPSGKKSFIGAGELLLKRTRERSTSAIDANLGIFAEILAFCHRQRIDTRLYVSPEHLLMTDLRHQAGYDGEHNDFLRRIIALNEKIAEQAGESPFPLWGFNLLEGIVDEPLHDGTGSASDWFRDGFHFYTRLGDIIMEQVWGAGETGAMLLDSDSLDTYLAAVEKLRVRFVRDQRQRVEEYRREILGAPRDREFEPLRD